MLRRLKVDVAKGLPPKSETLLMVGMSSLQKKLYKSLLLRDVDALDAGNKKNNTSVLNILMQLRKCCGHPYLFEGQEVSTVLPPTANLRALERGEDGTRFWHTGGF